MTTITPYLFFNGTCEEAFNFYKSAFGGEFENVSRYKDMPPNPEFPVPETQQEKIMHISLPISEETVLMGSDSFESFGQATAEGNNFAISINTDTLEEAERIFKALSAGGTVKMPLQKAFWGSHFAQFTDKFGIQWMISYYESDEK